MQEKKNKRLAILLLVLAAITVSVYWFGKKQDTPQADENLFRDFDLQTISKIQLTSAKGKVVLQHHGARWVLNEQHNANPDMMEVLFATLQQAQPKRPVASSLQDSVRNVLETEGVKVDLWSGEELVESFYAGGNESKTQAYFKKADELTVYVMTIPGYRVYVSGIFELSEESWRDKYVFGFNWRNFQALEARFKNEANRFEVVMERDFFTIKGITAIDTAKLNDFLDNVSLLTVDEYIAPPPSSDSLVAAGPVVELIVKDIARKEYSLKIFPHPQRRQYLGLIDHAQWAVFRENKIHPVVKPKDFFMQSR